MMKFLISLSITIFVNAAQAAPDVFAKYETLATELAGELAEGKESPDHIKVELEELVKLGYQIMDLYDTSLSNVLRSTLKLNQKTNR